MVILFSFSNEEDKNKFEYIHENYKKLLLYHAYQILKDYSLAEDAVSEAFIRIYKNIEKIDDVKSNSTIAFIVTITKNASITMYNKEKKQDYDELFDINEDGFNLESFVISKISKEEIFEIIDKLDESYKSVFLLKFAYDLTHKEIAETLDITENNVTVRLHRAKAKIAQILKKEGIVSE